MEPNSICTLADNTVIWADEGEPAASRESNLLRIHSTFVVAVDRTDKEMVFVDLPQYDERPEAARTLLAALAASMGIPKES